MTPNYGSLTVTARKRLSPDDTFEGSCSGWVGQDILYNRHNGVYNLAGTWDTV